MIVSFGDRTTEALYHGSPTKKTNKWNAPIQRRAILRLEQLNLAADLQDLRVPPSNRLKKLTGDLQDYWSIRINDQWRVIFRWESGNAQDVEITDYH